MKIKNMDINNQNQIINKRSGVKFWKFTAMFCGIIIGILVLYIIGDWAWRAYQWRQSEKIGKAAEESIKRWQQQDYEKAMADTYGGKTPQETLQMYIDAVEKGDYELASKYFIGDNQEGVLKEIRALLDKNNINWFLDIIKNAEPDGDIIDGFFRMKSKTEDNIYYFIRFTKYPNNIWKIIEI